MKLRGTHWLVVGVAGTLVGGLAWAIRPLEAQEAGTGNARRLDAQAAASARERGDGDTLVLIYPTGDRATSSLLVEAVSPEEVPVGKSYESVIRVTNLTDNLILEDVRIQLTDTQSITVERADLQSGGSSDNQARVDTHQPRQDDGQSDNQNQQSDTQGQQTNRQQAENQRADQQGSPSKNQQSENKSQGQNSRQARDQANNQGGSSQGPWSIESLGPGESRTLRISAVGEQEGLARQCIKVTYEPALCIATRFVQPEIALGKSAPEEANICRPLEYRYLIKNRGTGVARNVTIRDELPEGLKTAEGRDVVTFEVGDLAGGQEREYRTVVTACRTGRFASRAQAEGQDVSARSNQPETRVIAPELVVDLRGPDTHYVGQPLTYQATVSNRGDATAFGTTLRIHVADGVRTLRMSRASVNDSEPEQSGGNLSWTLGDLEPQAERSVSFTVSGREQGEFEHETIATALCDAAEACEEVKSMTTVAQTVTTNIMTLPALRLEMVDRKDPVKVGEETIYTVLVRNQGSGPDHNVQIRAELPENFEFVEASGATEIRADGRNLTFEPIEELGAGQKAQWDVRVKAISEGDVRNRIELNSEYLDKPVPEYEPTRVMPGTSE